MFWCSIMGCIHLTAILNNFLIFFIVCNTVSNNAVKVKRKKVNTFQELIGWAGPQKSSSQKPLDAVWQPVADTKHPFYVYSAFADRRREPSAVVVIGVTKWTRIKPSLFCRLWMRSSHTTYILEAKVKFTKEYNSWYNNVALVLCLLHKLYPKDVVGGSISVVSQAAPEEHATNLLTVLDTKRNSSGKPNLHMCVRPLHNYFDDVGLMIEWVELNRMMGVSHFYFYNMSIGARVECVLRNYENWEELFTILPFRPPVKKLWNEGQLVSSQDCLYRSMSRADWLMVIDLDEVVLPHTAGIRFLHETKESGLPLLVAMFNTMVSKYSLEDKHFAFLFRNAFFYRGFEDDPQSTVPLMTSRKTERLELLNWYGVRSKYAVQPSQAVELGVYKVAEFIDNKHSLDVFVGSNVLLLHHYRLKCVQHMCTKGYPTKMDRAAHMWTKSLWKKVQEQLADLDQDCFQNIVDDENDRTINL